MISDTKTIARFDSQYERGGVFSTAQPEYAEHGIATFPVTADKRPAVRGYAKIGVRGSRKLAAKHVAAPGLGFMAGKRSGLTVLDVDSTDERVVADAMARHGATPLISRTGSGHFQCWYQHHGEPRLIRPDPAKPIDILGGGMVIAPPSKIKNGYGFIQGCLNDLGAIPTMRGLEEALQKPPPRLRKGEGRNQALFAYVMRQAPACDDLDALIDVARTFAEDQFADAMTDAEIIKTARSAWGYQERQQNWVAHRRPLAKLDGLGGLAREHPDALALLVMLREAHRPGDEFKLARAMAEGMGWSFPRWRSARDKLRQDGWIICTHEGGRGPGDPPRYRFG